MRGWVYVISNLAIPNLVKIGFSMKDPQYRAMDFDGTGVPYSYVVEWDILIDEPRLVEQATHQLLKEKKEAKEWFRCSVIEAIQAVKKAAQNTPHYAERGVPNTNDQLPYPFEINNPDEAFHIWGVLLRAFGDKQDEQDEDEGEECNITVDTESPKSMKQYFKRAVQLESVDALRLVANWLINQLFDKPVFLIDHCAFFPYAKNISKEKAFEEANQVFLKIFPKLLHKAEAGELTSVHQVAICYLKGLGTSIDINSGIYWYSKAATESTFYANELAREYRSGRVDGEINHLEAFKWSLKSAQNGDLLGMVDVAIAYRDGVGVSANIESAKHWAEKAHVINAEGWRYERIEDLLMLLGLKKT